MSNATELARHEERAQNGIVEFAEEMQYIRDHNLYPGAKLRRGEPGYEPEPWATYCKGRWGMGKSMVDKAILAGPVLRRRARTEGKRSPMVTAAAEVAALPEQVQDKILDTTDTRDDVQAKAKAVRKVQRKAENEGRVVTIDELIEAAEAPVRKAKKPKPKHKSRFTSLLAQAVALTEDAADYAQSNPLSDTENEFGWSRVEKLRQHTERISEVLDTIGRPDHVRDLDEEWAPVLGGEE